MRNIVIIVLAMAAVFLTKTLIIAGPIEFRGVPFGGDLGKTLAILLILGILRLLIYFIFELNTTISLGTIIVILGIIVTIKLYSDSWVGFACGLIIIFIGLGIIFVGIGKLE